MDSLIARLKGGRFLVLGRAGMDVYLEPPGAKIECADNMVAHLGGSSANIAVALAKHGCKVSIASCVSDDAVGRFCINKLQEFSVDTQYVSSVAGEYRSSLAIIESTMEGHQSVFYRNGAADFMMSKADIDQINMDDYDAIVFTGTLLAADVSREATRYALDKARRKNLVRVFDVDYRPYSWASDEQVASVYKEFSLLAEIVVGNDDEFDVMANNREAGLSLAKSLAQRPETLCIYKMGVNGALSFYGDEEIKTGVFPVDALKPVGAGDAFIGGLLQSLVKGCDLKTSVLCGSACAAIVVSSVGCAAAMPDQAMLDTFLDQHDIV